MIKIFQSITAIALLFMGFSILTEDMPAEFLQHLQGLLFLFVAYLMWRTR